ncbi:hypothetical protein KCP69_15470 [Salmonella enterica subsp. enterica]|nr:hypothetical protein KCP69_15470 [Salmonella enterica subsp. enterica]
MAARPLQLRQYRRPQQQACPQRRSDNPIEQARQSGPSYGDNGGIPNQNERCHSACRRRAAIPSPSASSAYNAITFGDKVDRGAPLTF